MAESLDEESTTKRASFGIVAKTTLGMLVVGLVPLIVFGLVTLWQQNKRLRTDAERSMQVSAMGVSSQVDEWIDKNVRAQQATSNLDSMTSMSHDEQVKALNAMKKAYPWMYLAFTVNREKKNVTRSDNQPLIDYSDRKYVVDIIRRGQGLSWETLIGKASGKPALVITVPIKSNGTVVGALAAAMSIEDVSRIVATWKSGATSYAFLDDETNKVVAHPQSSFVLTQRKLDDQALLRAYRIDLSRHAFNYSDDGVEVLGAVQGNRMNWAVVVQQNTAELFAPLKQIQWLAGGLLLGAVVLVSIFSIFLSRMMVKPIVRLTNAANEMSLGNVDASISASSHDEIGTLAESFERLRQSMIVAMSRLDSH